MDRVGERAPDGPALTAADSPPARRYPATVTPVSPRLGHGLRALRHRNFRRFWLGALVSNSGTWLQSLMVGIVLFDLTGRAAWVGAASIATFLPSTIFSPLGGNLADRFDRRLLLVGGQSLGAVSALLLAGSWYAGQRSPWLIIAITVLGGVAGGLTIPAWQSFIPTLVPGDDLPSAISLNSLQFNIARSLGPALGAVVVSTIDPGWAFALNALSYGAVLVALAVITSPPPPAGRDPGGVFEGLREAIDYVLVQRGILVAITIAWSAALLGFAAFSFPVIYVAEVYEVGSSWVGIVTACFGVGAILAAPVVTGMFGDLPRVTVTRGALLVYGLSITVFGLSTTPWVGMVGMAGAGFGFLALVATSNTAMQSIVADHIRGRVVSARIMLMTSAFTIGNAVQTNLSDVVGPRPVVTTAGLGLISIAALVNLRPHLLRRLDDPPDIAPEPRRTSPTA